MDIGTWIDELRQTIIAASSNYDIWRFYMDPLERQKYNDVMNRYRGFFHTSINAHLAAMIMGLYQVYETRDDTYNIPTLLRYVRKQKILSDDAVTKLGEKYAAAKPLWVKVSILRNKIFAHKTVDLTSDEIFKETNVPPDQLRDLIEATKILLNEFSHAWNQGIAAFNLNATDDTKALLEDLKSIKF